MEIRQVAEPSFKSGSEGADSQEGVWLRDPVLGKAVTIMGPGPLEQRVHSSQHASKLLLVLFVHLFCFVFVGVGELTCSLELQMESQER